MSITEDGQGNVQINFEPRKEHPRRSYSTSSSNSFLEIRTPSRRSNVQSNLNLEEIDYSYTIPDLKYSKSEQNLKNPPDSPTYSQMMSANDEFAQLMMMIAKFDIDKEYLKKKQIHQNMLRNASGFSQH